MKKDQHYVVIKPIPIGGTKTIPVDTDINRTHGVYYMNGNLLPQDYQEDFDMLIEREEQTKWTYLCPVNKKTMLTNTKEDR
jgi:hypothetical protein